jgi:uncharacterized lipoprotein YehR (DUF1307 family)
MKKMKTKIIYTLIVLLLVVGCKKHPDVPENPVDPVDPVDPPLTEILVGNLFFHDNPQTQYDIYMANLYLVPKEDSTSRSTERSGFLADGLAIEGRKILRPGIYKFRNVEINGSVKERAVLNSQYADENIDISKYDIELKNLENLTDSLTDEFAVNVNSNNWIAFVFNSAGIDVDWGANEIAYMDINDRVVHQLTPVNGKYGRDNVDPNWKDDETIVWCHDRRIAEVNIYETNVNGDVIPELDVNQYDPVYSPDGTMLLFNAWHQPRKKNNFIKYVSTGQLESVLPSEYFNLYRDDNPTWIFSNTRITGHVFMPEFGRIYTRDIAADQFSIITDGERDFRYVTPVMIGTYTYLVFADWTDENHITLWICNEDGSDLRELNQTGDEPVFHILGLSVPQSTRDINDIARQYSMMFEH